jgi:hypothetical protein
LNLSEKKSQKQVILRTAGDTIGRDATDVAESFFEQLLMLQQMRFENPTFAKKYAKDTLKFMNF